MTIKECIDIVDNMKPNQYGVEDKTRWLSFLDRIIINDVLKTHEGYDCRFENFEGYSPDRVGDELIVKAPYDQMYIEYLKMKIDEENGETARYNNTATMFNSHLSIFKKWYNKTHMPLQVGMRMQNPFPPCPHPTHPHDFCPIHPCPPEKPEEDTEGTEDTETEEPV